MGSRRRRGSEREEGQAEKTAKRALFRFFRFPKKKEARKGVLPTFHSTSKPAACAKRLGFASNASRWDRFGESESLDSCQDASKEESLLLSHTLFPLLFQLSSPQNRLLAHGKKLSKVKIMSVNVSETW